MPAHTSPTALVSKPPRYTPFRELSAELVELGAPAALAAAALDAAADEVRHARLTAALPRRYGGALEAAVVARASRRSHIELARDNAAEGCVRETWGALLATVQAEQATDPIVRETMAVIAADETRHAALAWAIADWLSLQLDGPGRTAVASARAAALDELARAPVPRLSDDHLTQLGLPPAALAATLFVGFRTGVA